MDDARLGPDDPRDGDTEGFQPPRSRHEGMRGGRGNEHVETDEAPTAPSQPQEPTRPWAPAQQWPPPPAMRARPARSGNGFKVATLFRGLGIAVVGAVVTALVLGLLAELEVFLLWAALEGDRPSPLLFARLGGAMFQAFNRVGFVLELPQEGLPPDLQGIAPITGSARITVSLALMTGTVLAVWLLSGYARMVGNRAGGSRFARGLHGMKVALPYAAISLAAAYGTRFSMTLGGFDFSGHPSFAGAFLWPLGFGIVAGFVGGFLSLRERWGQLEETWLHRARGALVGGVWMLGLGLLFSFVGLLLLAAVKPEAASDYFSGVFNEGTLQGIAGIALHVLVIPNMAAWVLFPAMGACLSASGSALGIQASFCFLSYTQFPSSQGFAAVTDAGPLGVTDLAGPPAGYFAFLLAPLLAVVVGGVVAAWKGSAENRFEAAGIGAMAGVVFGLLSLNLLFVATAGAEYAGSAGGATQGVRVRLGPEIFPGFLLAVLWGVLGGALGGFLRGRAGRRSERAAWEVPPGGLPPGY